MFFRIFLWWCAPIIPALRRPRQEDQEFKASLGYIVRSFLKPNKQIRLVHVCAYVCVEDLLLSASYKVWKNHHHRKASVDCISGIKLRFYSSFMGFVLFRSYLLPSKLLGIY
jgi:hypothetical protein